MTGLRAIAIVILIICFVISAIRFAKLTPEQREAQPHGTLSSKNVMISCLLWIIILVVFPLVVFPSFSDKADSNEIPKDRSAATNGTATTQTNDETNRPSQEQSSGQNDAASDKEADTRKGYIAALRQEIDRQGLEASVIDDGTAIIYTSDDFKTSEMRSLFIHSTFKPNTRHNLCAFGFKSYEVRSGVFSGESERHPLGCPETPEERQLHLQENQAARQVYVNDIQNDFNQHPDAGLQLQDLKGEMVLSVKTDDLSLKESRSVVRQLQSTMDVRFDPSVKAKLCSIGFTGLRVRTSQAQVGAFESFHCAKQ